MLKLKYIGVMFFIMALSLIGAAKADYVSGLKYYNTENYTYALKEFVISAKQEDPRSQYMIGKMYYEGRGVTKNNEIAFEWFLRSAKLDYDISQYFTAIMYYNGEGVPQDFTKARYWFQKQADRGDMISIGMLGLIYYFGHGVQRDYEKAFELFEKSVGLGFEDSGKFLSMMYYKGEGTTQDYSKALALFRSLAESGDVFGMYWLGNAYYEGKGVEKDFKKALKYFQAAADMGDVNAQTSIAMMYYNGQGVPEDHAIAFKLFQKSDIVAARPEVQFITAGMYAVGDGVNKNIDASISYLEKSAQQGYAPAQFSLGAAYESGRALKKDNSKAIEWYKKAAAQNYKGASEAVERMKGLIELSESRGEEESSNVTKSKRIALLIGNDKYKNIEQLLNAENDANLLAGVLESAGFDVTVKSNLSQIEMQSTLLEFSKRIDQNTTSLIYYSGHGAEVSGVNYLIPIDFNWRSINKPKNSDISVTLKSDILDNVRAQSITLESFFNNFGPKAKKAYNIVILDACRDNPLVDAGDVKNRGLIQGGLNGIGLQTSDPSIETFTAYAASTGEVAADGNGQNSPYALALAKNLSLPNTSLTTAFMKVRSDVMNATNGSQVPATYGNVSHDFIFLKK